MQFFLKRKAPKPVVKMVVHGQRAYGQEWQEVTIAVDNDKLKVVENKPAVAPPSGRPIIVPAMGEMEMQAVDFLLEGARKSQEYGGKDPRMMPLSEYTKWVNQMWQDYAEQKLKWFQGKTTLGPGGFFQRESPGRKDW